MEVATLRKRCDATATEAANSKQMADALRNALVSVEAKLAEYMKKDVEVICLCGLSEPDAESPILELDFKLILSMAHIACPHTAEASFKLLTLAQVYTRIREAMEVAEEARLARDTSASRQRELEQEVETLQTRLTNVRQVCDAAHMCPPFHVCGKTNIIESPLWFSND